MKVFYLGKTWEVVRNRMNGMGDIESIDGVIEDDEIPPGYRMQEGEIIECVYLSDVKVVSGD